MSSKLYEYSSHLRTTLFNSHSNSEFLTIDYKAELTVLVNYIEFALGNENLSEYWSCIFLILCEDKSPGIIKALTFDLFIQYFQFALNSVLKKANSSLLAAYASCIDGFLVNEIINLEESEKLPFVIKILEVIFPFQNLLPLDNSAFKAKAEIVMCSIWENIEKFYQREVPGDEVVLVTMQMFIAFKSGLNVQSMVFSLSEAAFEYVNSLELDRLDQKVAAGTAEMIKQLGEMTDDQQVKSKAQELLIRFGIRWAPREERNLSLPREESDLSLPREERNLSLPREECEISLPRRKRDLGLPQREKYLDPPKKVENQGINEFIGKMKGSQHIQENEIIITNPPIYAMQRKDVHTSINIGTYHNKKVCIKTYRVLNGNNTQLQKAFEEIKVYERLSEQANENNCFLKYYGTVASVNSLRMVMDWYEKNLMEMIIDLKDKNFKINEILFTNVAHKLINSYRLMLELGILHNDIKPHNIMVDEKNWSFKIIDFDLALLKMEELTFSNTGNFLIKGTMSYLAPEQKQALKQGQSQFNFNREKADVYSLGLVLYQFLLLKDKIPKHQEILLDIDGFSGCSDGTKQLLKTMLQMDPTQRSTFKETLALVNKIEVTASFGN